MNTNNGMNLDWSRKASLWPTDADFAWKYAIPALYMSVTKFIVYLPVPMSTLKIKMVKTVVCVRPGSRIQCSERREKRKTAKEAPAGTHATERWQRKNAPVRKIRTSNNQPTNNEIKNQSKTNKKRLKMENGAPSFKNMTHFFRKRSIKPYNSSIDDSERFGVVGLSKMRSKGVSRLRVLIGWLLLSLKVWRLWVIHWCDELHHPAQPDSWKRSGDRQSNNNNNEIFIKREPLTSK